MRSWKQILRPSPGAFHGSLIAAALALSVWAAAEPPPPEDVDAAIDKYLQLDPQALAARLKEMKSQASAWEQEAQALDQKAQELENQTKAMQERLDKTMAVLEAIAAGLLTPPAPEAQPAMAEGVTPEVTPAMAEPAMTENLLNFQDDIRPVLQARCMRCHGPDRQRGGLSFASITTLMEGSSSGPVVEPSQPDASRLYRLAAQLEEPTMPPSGDPLEDAQLQLIFDWIMQGALADSSSKPVMAKEESKTESEIFIAAALVDGPPPMPEAPLPAPSAVTDRGVVARAVATSPRAPLLAVGGVRELLLYDLEQRSVLGALPFDEGYPYAITFSVNGELLLAAGGHEGDTGKAVLWNVRTGARLGTYGEAFDTVLAADISPDHRMVALGGPNKKVRVYATASGEELYELGEHTDWLYSIKFTPDGEVLATADRAGNLFLWQAANGRPVDPLRGHTGAIHDLAYSLDSVLLASAGADGTVQLWDTWTNQRARSFKAHDGAVLSVDFSDAGELVTTGSDGVTKRWDTNGKHLATYTAARDWGYQARFGAQDSVVLAGLWNGEVAIWDVASGEALATLNTSAR
jgi:cytochrome c/WD40 domain-containing protein